MADKQALRKRLIAERMEIKREVAKEASNVLAKHLLEIIQKGTRVAGYCAIRGEIDISVALEKLRENGSKIALPVIDEDSKILKFLECSPDTPLIAGRYGIFCPQPHLPEIIPDVVIIPLVAFDNKGYRIGYGGGYYDATISHLRAINKNIRIIGAAYAMQQVEKIEPEPHDEKMDMVVTEEEIIRFA